MGDPTAATMAIMPAPSKTDFTPRTVYLDSQDFSRFSPSHKDYSQVEPLREELLALKSEGVVQFVYSDVHVFESLPISREHSRLGLERIRTIAEFCGDASLTSSSMLFEMEMRALFGAVPLAEWTDWFPDFELEEPNRSEIYNTTLLTLATNRKQRRMGARALKKPSSATDGIQFAEKLVAAYPFLGSDTRTLQLYAMGKRPWSEVRALLRRSMRDIVGFSEWMVANWDQGQKFTKGLRDGNRKTQDSLTTLYRKMRSTFASSWLSEDMTSQLLKNMFNQQRTNSLSDFAEQNRHRLALDAPEQPAEGSTDWRQAPGLFTALSFLTELAYLSAVPKHARNPAKRTASDFADAMHVLFLPRVDFFRADQFSCSVLSKLQLPGGATLCPRLDDLPRLIRQSFPPALACL